ncbi:hypothetical protein H0H92_002709 [Tricholoma furcatifolium]|nr:hypothetical protein H0H92_002709 [Tricholoma furcatifolium]
MSAHNAVAITKPHTIDTIQVATPSPQENEVLIKVEYASLIPFDTYMSDLGYFVKSYPVIPGFNASGTIAKLGKGVVDLSVGDRVTAFCFTEFNMKGMQEYTVQPRVVVSKIPDSVSLPEAATIPDNLITSFYTLFNQLELPIPPSFPAKMAPLKASTPILIYGAGSTSGMYMIQLLRAAGYTKILATASERHHEYLKSIGASASFDYANQSKLTAEVAKFVGGDGKVPMAVDCIAAEPSMSALANIVSATATVAILLPTKKSNTLTAKHADDFMLGIPEDNAPFPPSAKLLGVRTFLYLEDSSLKENLASKIIPSLLETGTIAPSRVRLMEQGTFQERVELGMDLLRHNKISGEKVVVKVQA